MWIILVLALSFEVVLRGPSTPHDMKHYQQGLRPLLCPERSPRPPSGIPRSTVIMPTRVDIKPYTGGNLRPKRQIHGRVIQIRGHMYLILGIHEITLRLELPTRPLSERDILDYLGKKHSTPLEFPRTWKHVICKLRQFDHIARRGPGMRWDRG